MATLPVDDLAITRAFGPHLSAAHRWADASDEPDKLVKTHCCFCGQQCGIQLKVKDDEVIGFEPWDDFPSTAACSARRGQALPAGLAPRPLLTALERDPSAPGGFRPMATPQAIARAAREIGASRRTHGPTRRRARRREPHHREDLPDGQVRPRVPEDPNIDYNGRLCMVSAGAGNKKAFGIDRATNPWSDMVGTEVIWIAGDPTSPSARRSRPTTSGRRASTARR
jgi:assimilatory nitrate reductase catalytic subunit